MRGVTFLMRYQEQISRYSIRVRLGHLSSKLSICTKWILESTGYTSGGEKGIYQVERIGVKFPLFSENNVAIPILRIYLSLLGAARYFERLVWFLLNCRIKAKCGYNKMRFGFMWCETILYFESRRSASKHSSEHSAGTMQVYYSG